MKQKLLNKLWLRVGMIVAIMTTALSGTVKAQTVSVNDVLWSEPFQGTNTSTAFSATSSWGNYVNPTTFLAADASSLSYSSDKAMLSSTSSTNMTGAHVWLNKSVDSYIQVSGIKLYNATKVKVSWAQATSGSSTTVYYQFDGTGDFTSLSTCSGPNANFVSSELSVANHTTIALKFFHPSSNAKNTRIDNLKLTATGVASSTPTCETPTFSPAAGVYTSTQNVTISTTTEGATIYYTTDGSDPTTSSNVFFNATPIAVSSTTTIKAIAVKTDYNNSAIATAKYVFTEHEGTEDDPYTVAEARTLIDAGVGTQGVFVTGIVSEIVTPWGDGGYQNITFNLVDDEDDEDFLQAFRCVGDDASNVIEGDVAVVSGNLTKYNTTYEFASGCTVVSLEHPTVPTVIVGPTTLANFTYEVGDGPSTAKNIAVSGLNLTTDITLSLGENSNFEMSLAEASGYTNSLTLPQTSGAVAETTVYVRMKAGLDADDYEGTITISSTSATSQTVSLSGSVTVPEAPNVTWDLSTNSYEATPSETLITWSSSYATMTNAKGTSGTAVNNYIPTTRTSTRMYSGNVLTITPASGYAITSVVFTATTSGYATALKNSTWTNATATATESTVTVTPTDGSTAISAAIGGTCGFTEVKVYYEVDNTTYYNINLDNAVQNGNIAADKNKAAEGVTVTLTATPDENYALTEWTVLDGNADEVTVTVSPGNANVATFTMPASDVEVSATFTTTLTYYTVTIDNSIEHGTVESDKATAIEGATVTLTVTPDANYALNEILVVPDGTGDVAVTKVNNTTYTFPMPADNVTITAEFVGVTTNTYTLATTITSGKRYIIVGMNDDDAYAMGEQKTNNRAGEESVTVSGTTATVSSAAVQEFVIYGPDADGLYTIYDGTGYLYASSSNSNQLKTEATVNNNARWEITFNEGVASIVATQSSNRNVMRFNPNNGSPIFSCYSSASQSPVYLYEKDGEATPTESKTLNASGYATYCSENALDFTGNSDVTAWVITAANSTTGVITFSQMTKVPAGTGMLLKGEASQDATLTSLTGDADDVSGNLLEGTLASKEVAADEYYGLSGNEFVKVNAGTVPAGKALLPASLISSNEVKALNFVFEDDATGISLMEDGRSQMEDGAIYKQGSTIVNLAGQRINKMQKGINIVNGKKILK